MPENPKRLIGRTITAVGASESAVSLTLDDGSELILTGYCDSREEERIDWEWKEPIK